MKQLTINIILLLLFSFDSFAQYQSDCQTISTLDRAVRDLDNGVILSYNAGGTVYGIDNKSGLVRDRLLPLIDSHIYSNIEIIARLDCIKSTETITWLELQMINRIQDIERNYQNNGYYNSVHESPSRKKEIHQLIKDRTKQIMGEEFTHFGFSTSSNKLVKAIYFEHQNDVLSYNNQDRDLTGAFRFEILTDKLKLRIFRKLNKRWFYTYQGVRIGGEGYTPYIRDTTIFNTLDTFDLDDRPFASFKYLGWSKYRVSRKGRLMFNNTIKIGEIGAETGQQIQSIIHRDLDVGAVKPYGWGSQIAAGGRIAFSLELEMEYLPSILTSKYFNLSFNGIGKYGHDNTSLQIGVNLSNKDLKKRGGWNIPMLDNKNSDFVYNVRVFGRYVHFNSMLEGFGILKRVPDENATSPVDVHFLTRGRDNSIDQINEYIFGTEITLGWTFKNFSVFYKNSIWSPEFDLPVNGDTKIYPYADKGEPGSHNTTPWNHTGTIGIIFKN